jgi:hypothetical protein
VFTRQEAIHFTRRNKNFLTRGSDVVKSWHLKRYPFSMKERCFGQARRASKTQDPGIKSLRVWCCKIFTYSLQYCYKNLICSFVVCKFFKKTVFDITFSQIDACPLFPLCEITIHCGRTVSWTKDLGSRRNFIFLKYKQSYSLWI